MEQETDRETPCLQKSKEQLHQNNSQNQRKLITKDILVRTCVFSAVLLLFYGLLYLFFGSSLQNAGNWLGEHLGLWGVAAYCFLVDMFIVPTTVDVVFPFTLVWNPVHLLLVMSSASAVGGFCGYWIARSFNHWRYVRYVTARYRAKGEHFIDHYGAWAVAIAGFTPLPFSTICWIAGLLKVPWVWTAVACLSRFPRMILYYLLIQTGIEIFTL